MTTICLHLCHSTIAIVDATPRASRHLSVRNQIEASREASRHISEHIALRARRAFGLLRGGVKRLLASRHERAQALQFP
jgi:hypothetical protein